MKRVPKRARVVSDRWPRMVRHTRKLALVRSGAVISLSVLLFGRWPTTKLRVYPLQHAAAGFVVHAHVGWRVLFIAGPTNFGDISFKLHLRRRFLQRGRLQVLPKRSHHTVGMVTCSVGVCFLFLIEQAARYSYLKYRQLHLPDVKM
ncbi:hypothetical protein ACQKWADRAFT_285506, partial [Trichoderma austrokoningii]